jgi:hypothetical protein
MNINSQASTSALLATEEKEYILNITPGWIQVYGGSIGERLVNVVWLPPELRLNSYYCWAYVAHGNLAVIGGTKGRLIVIDFCDLFNTVALQHQLCIDETIPLNLKTSPLRQQPCSSPPEACSRIRTETDILVYCT